MSALGASPQLHVTRPPGKPAEPRCQVCAGMDLVPVLDLGQHPPSDGFLSEEQLLEPEPRYPLTVVFCEPCRLVQLTEAVDPTVLFGTQFIYRSGFNQPLKAHLESIPVSLATYVDLTERDLAIDIGSNDGTLLSNFQGADPIPEDLRRRDLQDIFVSLKASGELSAGTDTVNRGTTIALPYEVHIPALKYGQSQTLEFQLLRDVPSVVVASSFKGQQQEIDIQLQQAETENVVTITSTQISQEADLGSQATFDLRLERSTVDVRQFQLKVVNLPHQISYSFVDPNSQARLSQLNFPAGTRQQTLGLRLFLPEQADDQVRIDQPLEFWAMAMDETQAQRFQAERVYSSAEIEQSRAGRVRLMIIPRGVGRIEASAVSLFSEIQTGETVENTITIRNTGTRRLDNIKLTTEYPLNWRVEIRPDIIRALDINREANVKLTVIPPPNVPVGDYEVRIKTESYAYNRRVPSEDKIYRVSVKAQTNIWGTAGLIGGLLLLVIGIVVFGIKLTRR